MLHKCLTQPKMLKAWTLVLTHKTLHPTWESLTNDLDLTKRDWGELKRLLKGYSNGQKLSTHKRGGGVPFIGIWKTSCWGCQSRPVKPVHRTGQTDRVTPNWLRAFSELTNFSLDPDMSGVGRSCPEELKFQWSKCSPDLSSPRPDMSGKCL
jgi:hypothetical protein